MPSLGAMASVVHKLQFHLQRADPTQRRRGRKVTQRVFIKFPNRNTKLLTKKGILNKRLAKIDLRFLCDLSVLCV